MSKKTIAIIAGAAVVGLFIVLGVVSIIQGDTTSPGSTPGVEAPANATELTEADKQQIRSLTSQFVRDIGTYGWFSNTVADPLNAIQGREFFMTQNHRGADAIRGSFVTLMSTREFDAKINLGIFSVPFSVETTIEDDVVVPGTPTAEGGQTFVPVTVPIESTLVWVVTGMTYYNPDGSLHTGDIAIERHVFQGDLSLRFARQGGGWIVTQFTQDVGVFPTDDWGFVNGGLVVNTTPVKSDRIQVTE